MNGNIQQRNILNSTVEVIPQQIQRWTVVQVPVQHCELLPRVVLVVVLVEVVWVVVDVGVAVGAPVATATDDDDDRGCVCGGCGGFPVE